MRVMRRSQIAAASASLVAWLLPIVSAISVPTGKLTPITPARPTARTVNPHAPANPAAVVEYSQDQPEPPPLDPSYVPQSFNYFNTLAKHHVYYYPVRYRNFNALSNDIEYEPPQKFQGQTLGKNYGYKPHKQHLTVPYYPVWASQQYQPTGQYNSGANNQYNNGVDNQYNNGANNQYNNGANNQYNNGANNQYNNGANNQYNNGANNQYNNGANNQYNNGADTQYNSHYSNGVNDQYNPQASNQYNQPSNQIYNNQYQQPTQPQQQYEAVSTQTAAASTPSTLVPKVDYSTGKGSYDVTGKGGSKSEYYTKEDWSKKTAYPKKVLSTRNSKFPGKY